MEYNIKESIQNMDTVDYAMSIIGLIGTLVLTNGIVEFYGKDLTTMLNYSLGGFTFTAASIMVIAAAVGIIWQNDLQTEDILDYNAVEGIGFISSVGTTLLIEYEPQFVTDNILNDPTGGFVAMIGIVGGLAAMATQPHWDKK